MSGVIAVALYGAFGIGMMSVYFAYENYLKKQAKRERIERSKYSTFNGKKIRVLIYKK